MNQISNIEDFKKAIDEGVMVDEHGFIYIKKAELFRLMDKYIHQQLQKAREGERERAARIVEEMMEDDEYWQPIAQKILTNPSELDQEVTSK